VGERQKKRQREKAAECCTLDAHIFFLLLPDFSNLLFLTQQFKSFFVLGIIIEVTNIQYLNPPCWWLFGKPILIVILLVWLFLPAIR
jgi:hypothetical protein